MKITVIGNCGPYPGAGRACSGYLVESRGTRILLDCGSGVLGKLQNYCNLDDITHIILSHLHYDHMGDMMVLRYSIEGKAKRGRKLRPVKLYLPPEPKDVYEKLISKDVFDYSVITEGLSIDIGGLEVSFAKVNHPITCYATRIQQDSKVFVYSGDTSYAKSLVEIARNAEILLCDAGLLSKDNKSQDAPHLTAYEAGVTAREANVKRLLLTHFWPEDHTGMHLEEAGKNFPDAELAIEGRSYEI